MEGYVTDFVKDVLSLVNDSIEKDDILSGKKSIGDFLENNAHKGIDPNVVLECLSLYNHERLYSLACRQNRINAYYAEWFERFVLRHGPTYIQSRIDEELEQGDIHFTDDNGDEYFVNRRLVLVPRKKNNRSIGDNE